MSSRRTSNLQLREAVIQRFISEIERKYSEESNFSNEQLINKRKKQDMKLFLNLIDPDSDNILKTASLEKLKIRILRSTSVLFTLNDMAMLNTILSHTFATRPSILDDPRFRRRQRLTSISSQNDLVTPTNAQRSRQPSIRSSRREPSDEQITPGVWVRGTSFPTYTTQTPRSPTVPSVPTDVSSSSPIQSAQVRSLMPQTPLAPIRSLMPQTPSQPTQDNVPWGYEDTSTTISSLSEFEEDKIPDTKIRTNKNSLIINGDKLTTCYNENNDPDPNERTLSEDNKQWVENNCYSCQDIATQYNYTQEQWSDLVSIKQLDSKGKFKLSQCTSIKYFKVLRFPFIAARLTAL